MDSVKIVILPGCSHWIQVGLGFGVRAGASKAAPGAMQKAAKLGLGAAVGNLPNTAVVPGMHRRLALSQLSVPASCASAAPQPPHACFGSCRAPAAEATVGVGWQPSHPPPRTCRLPSSSPALLQHERPEDTNRLLREFIEAK